ncbi:pentatricopeptide repeat-containing protein At3g57430, chloroplastic-like [Henckelia pumila]|uniref:pentatricopeptide repeat-containing protein At3g57430, chloroplastic-like n=1 Tax=Henckelia pumila TaxID=405737 RepID=UPI003C6DBE92
MITFSIVSASKKLFKYTHRSSLVHTFAPTLHSTSCFTTIFQLLALSIETQSLRLSLQSHARSHHLGVTQHPLIAQKLIFSYCYFEQPADARLLFDSLFVKNLHICNTLLSGYGKNQLFLESFEIFREMSRFYSLPSADEFTFSVILKSAGEFGDFFVGQMVHGRGLKDGLLLDTVVGNSLMSMYCRCGSFEDSMKVFDEMPHRNVSSWNTVLAGYAKLASEKAEKALDYFSLWDFAKGMQAEGLRYDAFTISTLLPLCGEYAKSDKTDGFDYGRELHCYIVKNGLDSSFRFGDEVHIGCCLIDMYSKNCKIFEAKMIFDRLKYKNVFSWTAMINGYVLFKNYDDAFLHFREMQWGARIEPNKVSLVTILPACSSFTGLMGGKQIHGFSVRREMNNESSLCNALIDMYSKCGSLHYSRLVFEHECIDKDAISWSSMIFGYGLHGQGQQAIMLFDEMLQNGIKPDITVVVGVLSACCRSGLFNDGIRIYESCVYNYDVEPTLEMCACMVDVLSSSGQFDRALNFIKTMPMEPGPSIWGAIMSASALHGNSYMADLAYKSLMQIEPENSSNYIWLSNIYASSKRWDNVAKVRMMMKERGLRKSPGCSWININSTTHSFMVSDKSHPRSDSIYMILDQLVSTMKLSHYIPDFVYLIEVIE